ATGYQPATGQVVVGTTNVNMNNVTVNEIANPASGVVANESADFTQVDITWNAPGTGPTGFFDDFESYADFAIDFAPWTVVDVDLSTTYGFQGITFPNTGVAMAYMIFNPSMTTPILEHPAHSGAKMAACFASTTPPNNDWLISPQVTVGGGDEVSFWAQSYMEDYGLERFKVGVSTTGTAPANFTIISGATYVEAPIDWTNFTYSLAAYTGQQVYVGIQCVSNDAFIFFLDDFSIGAPMPMAKASYPVVATSSISLPRSVVTPNPVRIASSTAVQSRQDASNDRTMMGYRVWRLLASDVTNEAAWTSLTTANVTPTEYTDTTWQPMPSGVYKYAVKAAYTNGVLSAPAFSNSIDKGMMGVLTGTITEFGTDLPIAGVTVTAGTYSGITNATGAYSVSVYAGTYNVTAAKVGYQPASQANVVIVGLQSTTQNFVMTEITLPVTGVSAVVAGSNVNITWSAPGAKTSKSVSTLFQNVDIDPSRALTGYKVWRLIAGQETNETGWTSLTTNPISATAYQDAGWGDLPDGTYKWAVKAVYTAGALSIPTLSNQLNKLTQVGTIAGIVRDQLNAAINGATVTSGEWTATTNAQGAYSVTVPAGTHSVIASHPNYASSTQTGVIVVTGSTTTVNFVLAPTANLLVDGFETYTDFAISFAPWTCVDVDLSTTYGMTGTTWLNGYAAQAYIVFNPSATVPVLTTIIPHAGAKMAACFASVMPPDGTGPNNDWLITPQLTGASQIKFWARSHIADYGLERFKVGVSTTGTAPANFTIISGATYIEAPVDWTEFTYSITTGNVPVYIGIQCVSNDAFIFFVDDVSVIGSGSANGDENAPVVATELTGNYPNPFNPETTISFNMKETAPVSLEIYNVKGQLVKTMLNGVQETGNHSVVWNGKDNNGRAVSSGVYYYKMNTGKYSSTKKMIMMK
ncbi:MAG: choice-of-anchor J domain-containing protein, partial [Candidatus Cloacimonetes bacterium]|nr:choice-of-anchor J domain-containing protein [Candidatus Cloacimonadota bacterium]